MKAIANRWRRMLRTGSLAPSMLGLIGATMCYGGFRGLQGDRSVSVVVIVAVVFPLSILFAISLGRARPSGSLQDSGRFGGKLWLLRCLRGSGVYDLTRRRGVTFQVQQRKQPALQRAHAGQTGGCRVLSLALPARVNDEGLLNFTQLFQNAVDAQFLTLTGQFPL